jgi:hypothetical protein
MKATVLLAVLNFFAFICANVYLGGDALNGYVRDGHYFLCAHGGCTEVSRAVWTYSYWHAITAFGGIILLFAEIAVFAAIGDIVLDFNAKT